MNDQQIIYHLKAGGIVGFRLDGTDDVATIHARLNILSHAAGRSIMHMRQPGPVPAVQAWIEDAYSDDQADAGFVWANGDNNHEHAD